MNKKEEAFEEFKKKLKDEYKERTGRPPSQALDTFLELLDENVLQGYLSSVEKQEEIFENNAYYMNLKIHNTQRELQAKIDEANAIIDTAIEAQTQANKLTDERMANALRLYMAIASMKFDSPDLTKINLRNASYVVWAACMNAGDISTPFSVFGADNDTSNNPQDGKANDEDEFKPVQKRRL